MSRPLTLDDLSAVQVPADPTLSPDGTRVVHVLRTVDPDRDADHRSLWLIDTTDGAADPRPRARHGTPRASSALGAGRRPTGDRGRVLRADGSAIAGRYAAGNSTASLFGGVYPGPAAPLGSTMVLASLVTCSAEHPPRDPEDPDHAGGPGPSPGPPACLNSEVLPQAWAEAFAVPATSTGSSSPWWP